MKLKIKRLMKSLSCTRSCDYHPQSLSCTGRSCDFSSGQHVSSSVKFDEAEDNGCDCEHWLIQLKDQPVGSRDEIIQGYVQLVAKVLGSEDEARKKIYSASTKYYFAVGVLVSKDVAYKWKPLNEVQAIIADCYVDRATKDYGGEPFVDGKPVPYDPKHHAFYHRVQEKIRDTSDITQDSINDRICSTSMIGLRFGERYWNFEHFQQTTSSIS